ncbi:hypothetical protein GOODEAATRI_027211, partial [Goodea atripinnis]
ATACPAKWRHSHPETQNQQHPGQPSKTNRAKPSHSSPRANTTATPHILLYVGKGTVKTTNPKHTSLTRNHPADKQTPPQYKAEKPDATHPLRSTHTWRPEPMRTGSPPQHHSTSYSGGQNAAKSAQSKRCAQSPQCANMPQQPSKNKTLCNPVKRRHTETRPENMPDTHTLA